MLYLASSLWGRHLSYSAVARNVVNTCTAFRDQADSAITMKISRLVITVTGSNIPSSEAAHSPPDAIFLFFFFCKLCS